MFPMILRIRTRQAGEIELAEFGHAKGKDIEKIFRILLYDRCKSGIRRFERRKNQRVKAALKFAKNMICV